MCYKGFCRLWQVGDGSHIAVAKIVKSLRFYFCTMQGGFAPLIVTTVDASLGEHF